MTARAGSKTREYREIDNEPRGRLGQEARNGRMRLTAHANELMA
jgi:hypothetical protein